MDRKREFTTDSAECVHELLVREFEIAPQKITPEARIREDLGICGDDGMDLFVALRERFRVDLSEYQHDQHFERESFDVRSIFTKAAWKYQSLLTINVSQLVDAVRTGKWNYGDI